MFKTKLHVSQEIRIDNTASHVQVQAALESWTLKRFLSSQSACIIVITMASSYENVRLQHKVEFHDD